MSTSTNDDQPGMGGGKPLGRPKKGAASKVSETPLQFKPFVSDDRLLRDLATQRGAPRPTVARDLLPEACITRRTRQDIDRLITKPGREALKHTMEVSVAQDFGPLLTEKLQAQPDAIKDFWHELTIPADDTGGQKFITREEAQRLNKMLNTWQQNVAQLMTLVAEIQTTQEAGYELQQAGYELQEATYKLLCQAARRPVQGPAGSAG